MKVVVSLTSIPSRFVYLPSHVASLLQQKVDQVIVSLPYTYNRFPDVEVEVPDQLYDLAKKDQRVIINRCKDYGPGIMYMGPAMSSDADIVIVVNDDTQYPSDLTQCLLQAYQSEKCCWCLSGFVIDEYIKNNGVPHRWNTREVDVTESYGGVLLENKWLKNMVKEFPEMYEVTYNDDIIVSNLLAKMGVKKRTLCTNQCNLSDIKQYTYGMGEDALFQNSGDGSHYKNNCKVFKELRSKGLYYFKINNDRL